jgi:ATP-dependent Clp protease ATP-binding subunit ClpC
MGELKKVFRPEFLNRIDEVIVFHKLSRDEIKEIVELLMRRLRESMAERELSLNLSDRTKEMLVDKGWDPAMGARPLRRAIQRYIEDPLADEMLKTSMEPGSTVEVDTKDGKKVDKDEEPEVTISVAKPKKKKREAVGVGAKGGDESLPEGASEEGAGEEGGDGDLPEDSKS